MENSARERQIRRPTSSQSRRQLKSGRIGFPLAITLAEAITDGLEHIAKGLRQWAQAQRAVPERRWPPISTFGLFPPEAGRHRATPTTHKPNSQELKSPWLPSAWDHPVYGG